MTDRIQRLTLRLLPKRAKPCTQAGVDHFMRVEYRADTYYIQDRKSTRLNSSHT